MLAGPGTAFDLYVGDESAEVISLEGAVDFVLGDGGARYAVEAGGVSIISDGKLAVEGDGQVDAAWDEWNLDREALWTQRVQVRESQSITSRMCCAMMPTISTGMAGGSKSTIRAGSGSCGARPGPPRAGSRSRAAGGRYGGDNVWIPEEPFGYVTHHYGNWVFVNSVWYWAPPVKARAGAAGKSVCWYPGASHGFIRAPMSDGSRSRPRRPTTPITIGGGELLCRGGNRRHRHWNRRTGLRRPCGRGSEGQPLQREQLQRAEGR